MKLHKLHSTSITNQHFSTLSLPFLALLSIQSAGRQLYFYFNRNVLFSFHHRARRFCCQRPRSWRYPRSCRRLRPEPRFLGYSTLSIIGNNKLADALIVDQNLARNCTTISPCQQDSTIIRDSEITQNIVNSCGRTEINGNIDVGEQTENELAANRVTTVSSGSVMTVTIHQVSGLFACFTT
jgi:hypothetical protein